MQQKNSLVRFFDTSELGDKKSSVHTFREIIVVNEAGLLKSCNVSEAEGNFDFSARNEKS